MSTLDAVMIIEGEAEDDQEIIDAFQEMIDSGVVWKLQGHYGRTATHLINQGLCHAAEETDHE